MCEAWPVTDTRNIQTARRASVSPPGSSKSGEAKCSAAASSSPALRHASRSAPSQATTLSASACAAARSPAARCAENATSATAGCDARSVCVPTVALPSAPAPRRRRARTHASAAGASPSSWCARARDSSVCRGDVQLVCPAAAARVAQTLEKSYTPGLALLASASAEQLLMTMQTVAGFPPEPPAAPVQLHLW